MSASGTTHVGSAEAGGRTGSRMRMGLVAIVAVCCVPCSALLGHDPEPPPREFRLRAVLDQAGLADPDSSSPVGEMDMLVTNSVTGEFVFVADLQGVLFEDLDLDHGGNLTAIHIGMEGSGGSAPVLLIDVHHLAWEQRPDTLGILSTEGGIRLEAVGRISRFQGENDSGLAPFEISDFLRVGATHVSIYTDRFGELRAPLESIPERLELRAALSESQVVRPIEFRPPTHGTGSGAVGVVALSIDTVSDHFSLDLEVEGIDLAVLDASHGANATAVHVRAGGGDERGEVLLDVHYYARQALGEGDGVSPTASGFRLRASGTISRLQGALDTGRSPEQILDYLRRGEAFVSVSSTTNPLFQAGEIRGNLEALPTKLEFRARLDQSQVVRPFAFQPPSHGTGSIATGDLILEVDRDSGFFSAELEVSGIDPATLDSSHGDNGTAIQIHWGFESTTGPIILDLQHYARRSSFGKDGIEVDDGTLRLVTEGFITRVQGEHDTNFDFVQVLNFLRSGETYVTVNTSTTELFRQGEIRGNVEEVPSGLDTIRLEAQIDPGQVIPRPGIELPRVDDDVRGSASLTVDTRSREFGFVMDVSGVRVEDLSDDQGANGTSVLIAKGTPNENGPILLDVHFFALHSSLGENRIDDTPDGFRIEAGGRVSGAQGLQDTGFNSHELVDFLRRGEAYVEVHFRTGPASSVGEIRGNLFAAPAVAEFIRGDCDGDGLATGTVTDAVFLLAFNFIAGPRPPCLAACDVDGDGQVAGVVTDAVYQLTFNFLDGPPPVEPFPGCGSGEQPGDASLDCAAAPGCQ